MQLAVAMSQSRFVPQGDVARHGLVLGVLILNPSKTEVCQPKRAWANLAIVTLVKEKQLGGVGYYRGGSITPVPKIAHPVECKDFRPISVTPVLSRVMERFIVRSDLYPLLVRPDFSHLFSDQFAFRPSGSTTAALIYLFHQLTHLLQKYEYVHLIALDFSKAFDSVKRSILLLKKLLNFPLKTDNVYNWIVNFLTDRHHQTKAKGSRSER